MVAWITCAQQYGLRVYTLRRNPRRIVVLRKRPVMTRRVAVLKVSLPIIHSGFSGSGRASQMKLSDQATIVACVSQQTSDEIRGDFGVYPAVTVAGIVDATRIHARQKTRTTGRANGALTIRVGERCAFFYKRINVGRMNIWIAERGDRIEPLLIGAVPKNVGALLGHHVNLHRVEGKQGNPTAQPRRMLNSKVYRPVVAPSSGLPRTPDRGCVCSLDVTASFRVALAKLVKHLLSHLLKIKGRAPSPIIVGR